MFWLKVNFAFLCLFFWSNLMLFAYFAPLPRIKNRKRIKNQVDEERSQKIIIRSPEHPQVYLVSSRCAQFSSINGFRGQICREPTQRWPWRELQRPRWSASAVVVQVGAVNKDLKWVWLIVLMSLNLATFVSPRSSSTGWLAPEKNQRLVENSRNVISTHFQLQILLAHLAVFLTQISNLSRCPYEVIVVGFCGSAIADDWSTRLQRLVHHRLVLQHLRG